LKNYCRRQTKLVLFPLLRDMKLFYSFSIFFILVSCHTARIKKVPVEIVSVPQESRAVNHPDSHTGQTPGLVASYLPEEEEYANAAPESSVSDVVVSSDHPTHTIERKQLSEDDPEVNQEKAISALRAERRAKTSSSLLVGSLIISIVSILFPPLLLFTLVLLIIGAVLYSKANSSRYITQEGLTYLKRAYKLIWVTSIIAGIILLAYGLLIALFFL